MLWHKAEYKDIAMYQQVLNAEWAKIPNYSVIHCPTVVQCDNFDHHVDIEQMCKAVIVACIHSSNVCIYRQLRRLMQRSTNAYLAGKNMYVLSRKRRYFGIGSGKNVGGLIMAPYMCVHASLQTNISYYGNT